MATIRKRHNNYQVQIRRKDALPFSKTFATKKEATSWIKAIKEHSQHDTAIPVLQPSLTLQDLIERYLKEVVVHKRSCTIEQYILRACLRQAWVRCSVHSLRSSTFAQYRDERLRSVKPATISRELGLLSHVFTIAMTEWNLPLTDNPLQNVRRPTICNARDRRLTKQEETILFQKVQTCSVEYMYPILVLALETAMRQGEILSMQWSHVDWNTHVVTLPLTKNGTMRRVPLSHKAITMLREYHKGHTDSLAVFTVTRNAFKKTWQRLMKRCSFTDLRFHDLRHEATSRLFEKGLNVMEVASITGHKDVRMLFRYTHPRAETLAQKL